MLPSRAPEKRSMHPPTLRAGPLLLALTACSDREPVVPAGALQLLCRLPDATFEQPGEIVPRGDLPDTATWGPYEGPGWSQTLLQTAEARSYLETNQPEARLNLPALRPVDRELELELWCSRPAGDEPGPLELLLNGLALGTRRLSREPELLRIPAPSPLWGLGENELELRVPVQEIEGRRRWDSVALARISYGPEVRVRCDTAAGTALLPAGAGLRYCVELADAAELHVAGRCDGAGTLQVRLGRQDRRTGEHDAPSAQEITARGGRLEGRAPLPRTGELTVVELEWSSESGASATLERLAVVERRARSRPPIVLVSIDTFAARHLSLHGYGRETSPNLEALARDALVFEHAWANAPWTMPSYLSLMTGLYPRAHHVPLDRQSDVKLDNWDWWQVAENRWTLAEALRARGYRTAGFVDTYWLSPHFGVDQGFDLYDGQAALASLRDPHAHIQRIVGELLPPWLAAGPADAPFFLFVHALDAHGPYWPDEPFRDSFSRDLPGERRSTRAGSTNETYGTIPAWMARTLVPDETVPVPLELPLEDIIARYDEAILKVDAYLGKLFELLKQRGLYDPSVIVVTGDHGESFGPLAYGHGVMRGEVLHVPLIVKLPGNERGGQRSATPVQLVDLYPTLLELAGAGLSSLELHGTALLEPAGSAPPRVLYSEGGHVEQYALEQDGWKLVEIRPGSESGDASLLTHPRVPRSWLAQHFPELLSQPLSDPLWQELRRRPGYEQRLAELRALLAGPYYELFDLKHDPLEEHDLAAERADLVERLKPLLEREKERSARARADAAPGPFRHKFDPAELEALRDLGYGD